MDKALKLVITQQKPKKNRKTRRKPQKQRLFVGLLAAFALLTSAAVFFVSQPVNLAEEKILLPFSKSDSFAVYNDGVVYHKDGILHALNLSGKELWYTDFPRTDVRLAASSEMTAAYTPSIVHVYNSNGSFWVPSSGFRFLKRWCACFEKRCRGQIFPYSALRAKASTRLIWAHKAPSLSALSLRCPCCGS